MSKTSGLGTIQEVKTRLDGSVERWTCDLLAIEEGRHAVLRHILDRDRALDGTDLVLRSGTITIAHYWSDRQYNLYHWLHEGKTVAYYASIATATTISRARIAYLDLAVDVLVHPSGALDILDEDEVPPDIAPAHRKTIADALEVLVTRARPLMAEVELEASRLR